MRGSASHTLKDMMKETRLKPYKHMAILVILYRSEYLTLTKPHAKRIETDEMRFLINIAEYIHIDLRKSEDICLGL